MAENGKKRAESPGLGSIVFIRDTARPGRRSRDNWSISTEEAKAAAKKLDVPPALIPQAQTDRKLISIIALRAKQSFASRGIFLKQRQKKRDLTSTEVYERKAGEGNSSAMKFVGVISWKRDDPWAEGGTVHWTPEPGEPDDHVVPEYYRQRFAEGRGRISIYDWAEAVRELALGEWMGYPARHEGRVYWVPEAFIPMVERFSELTEEIGAFAVVAIPLPDRMAGLVEGIIRLHVESELEELGEAVQKLQGAEPLAHYTKLAESLDALERRVRSYTNVLVPLAMGSAGPALSDEAARLRRIVEESYIRPYHEAKARVAGHKVTKAGRRAKYLHLPVDAPEAPPVAPIEMAPKPDPFMVIGSIAFHIDAKASTDQMTCFASGGNGAADALARAFSTVLEKWSAVGRGHMYPTVKGGPPRVYLTEVSAEAATFLQQFGVALSM